MANNPYVNKVVKADGTTIIDISDTTAVAADVASGKYFYTAAGQKVPGTASGGGGSGISTETIIPSQSIDCSVSLGSNTYGGYIQPYTEYIENEEEYIVTFDGTEYFARGHYRSSSILVVGDYYLTTGTSYNEFPFCIILQGGSLFYLAVQGTGTHTLKVDKIISYSGGGGGGSTLTTKTITQNGTYDAEDDNADGYSSVTVNVPSGASNVVTGTFKGTTTGAAMDVTLNYSGSGYPIAVMIYPKEGAYNASTGSIYSLVQRYAIMWFIAIKNYISSSPDYNGTGNEDSFSTTVRYKNNASNATGYSQNISPENAFANNVNAVTGNNGHHCVYLKSKTKMSVYIASSSYGFAANVEYTYQVIYSS